ncbi:3'-5' exoribonuclease domain-containing protein [Streptomyces sp.]|uniref:3'-5' exoribonuclease domain-containing protein n=1 Tax=Streptomyces sp. TaxID=1931 RepID=UPI002F92842D
MKIFYDTEFIEDGRTIDLISIGMIAEDGRQYYAVNRDMPHKRIAKSDWLRRNVVPSLPRIHGDRRLQVGRGNPLALDFEHPDMKRRQRIADGVHRFIQATPDVELWASYGAYDHVVLAQLFGSMVDLPEGVPMFTNDIQQEIERLDVAADVPQQEAGHHNALADAEHVRLVSEFLITARLRQGM